MATLKMEHCFGSVGASLGIVTRQWRSEASDPRLREPGFEYLAAVSNLGQVRSLYIAPFHYAV